MCIRDSLVYRTRAPAPSAAWPNNLLYNAALDPAPPLPYDPGAPPADGRFDGSPSPAPDRAAPRLPGGAVGVALGAIGGAAAAAVAALALARRRGAG